MPEETRLTDRELERIRDLLDRRPAGEEPA
jgi:hypothetical protein